MDFKDKTVLITGASRGIGAETARVFAAAGANVALLARSADSLEALAAEIGENALALACDVSDYASVEAAVKQTVERFGGLDVLINNAGVLKPIGPMVEADPEGWGSVIDINIKGVFNGMRAAVPLMKAAGGGSVLTVSSGAAHNPLEGWGAYCTSKAGAAMLTRALDLEERGNGIRAIGLSPGTVATEMQREIKASGINRVSDLNWEDHVPAEWPAKVLLWMCSAGADEYVGTEISLRDEDIRKQVGLI
ncbi:short-chain dehydrogenase [Sedimentitalea sp. CY04]|uniref:Short-chain dehydrogenase n=1 Tax=Parasedimentitalea denitrificans TaxID=2211118 RepID=A0ABX0W871_9RHOB|nr:SDR family oxidoreductase [Sedimentitalea sp. CY04]NIZ61854.1 short-chain dehydrogenase [Sedimentitalea sp. CY04]